MANAAKPKVVTGDKPALPKPEAPKPATTAPAAVGKPVPPPPGADAPATPAATEAPAPAAPPADPPAEEAPASAPTKNFGEYLLQQEVNVQVCDGETDEPADDADTIKVFLDIATNRPITGKADGHAYVKEEELAGRFRIAQKKAVFTSGSQTTFKIKEEK